MTLKQLVAALQNAAVEADRTARRELIAFLVDASQKHIEGLPGNPTELSLLPQTQMGVDAIEMDVPVWLADEGRQVMASLQPNGEKEALIRIKWSRVDVDELAHKLRDAELQRLTWEVEDLSTGGNDG